MNGRTIKTFSSDTSTVPLETGINEIGCIECGGAEPGKGCAGKGMGLLFSRIQDLDADYRVCDVLGDVVCGGFSIPMRPDNCDSVLIITSGEFMSLYAANNILKGLENINPGKVIVGLVFNRRGDDGEEEMVRRFSEAVGIPVVCDIPRSNLFREAEAKGEVLSSLYPDSEEAKILRGLCDRIAGSEERFEAKALSDEAMGDLAAGREIRDSNGPQKRAECSFDSFDSERNLSYLGEFVMPACTSHGAADAAMKVKDAAVILHGPRNCAYLMEYAFQRRVLNGAPDRVEMPPRPGIYSTGLDASEAFTETGSKMEETVLKAKADGYQKMFLIHTCSSAIIGIDLRKIADDLGKKHSVEIIPVDADPIFLGSKFGGLFGFFDTMISRMGPRETEKGTVNLIARWFYGIGKDKNLASIQDILSRLGLRIRFCFLDFSTMAEIEDFCKAEYDIALGRMQFNKRISERISEVTGRREPLQLEAPDSLNDCLKWVRKITDYAPELMPMRESAEKSLKEEYWAIIDRFKPMLAGKRMVIYCVMVRDLKSQVDTLRDVGVDIAAVMFVNGLMKDHNLVVPDYGDVKVMEDARMCDLKEIMSDGSIDLVVTNDSYRVPREGIRWSHINSRYFGLKGTENWLQTLVDSMNIIEGNWERGL